MSQWYYPIPDPNEDMVERDDIPEPPDPNIKRLHDLAEKAIVQGQAQQAADAIEPIVSPKTDETATRNLGRLF